MRTPARVQRRTRCSGPRGSVRTHAVLLDLLALLLAIVGIVLFILAGFCWTELGQTLNAIIGFALSGGAFFFADQVERIP